MIEIAIPRSYKQPLDDQQIQTRETEGEISIKRHNQIFLQGEHKTTTPQKINFNTKIYLNTSLKLNLVTERRECGNGKNLKTLHQNIDSLINKTNRLDFLLEIIKPHLLILTEHGLKDNQHIETKLTEPY